MLRQLRPYLLIRAGLIDFYHTSIRRAVEIRYLGWNTEVDQRDPWARWNPPRQRKAREPTEAERAARQRLIDFFERSPRAARSVDELPWQLASAHLWERLFELMSDPMYALRLGHDLYEWKAYWTLLGQTKSLRIVDGFRSVLSNPESYPVAWLGVVATLLRDLGHPAQASQLFDDINSRFREDGTSWMREKVTAAESYLGKTPGLATSSELKELAEILSGKAAMLFQSGDLTAAMELYKKAERLYIRVQDDWGIITARLNQAVILQDLGRSEEALSLHQTLESKCREPGREGPLAMCLENQGVIHESRGELVAAMKLYQTATSLCRLHLLKNQLASSLAREGQVLALNGDLGASLTRFQDAENSYREIGDKHGLAGTLMAKANTLRMTDDLTAAVIATKEALKLAKEGEYHVLQQQINYNLALLLKHCPSAPMSRDSTSATTPFVNPKHPDIVLEEVRYMLNGRKTSRAWELLSGRGGTGEPFLKNAKGVCLLRLQETDRAIAAFRDLVVSPNRFGLLPHAPTVFKTNFATALLMSNDVLGCVRVLNEINDEQNETVQRLRAVIKQWKEGLTFWQRLMSRIGIRPCAPILDYPPGELS